MTDVDTVAKALAVTVEKHGDREALVWRENRYTWLELDSAVRTVAEAMVHQGVSKGDRVMIVGPNDDKWVIRLLACHVIGAVVCPINTRMTAHEIVREAFRYRPKLLFIPDSFLKRRYVKELEEYSLELNDDQRETLASLRIVVTGSNQMLRSDCLTLLVWEDFIKRSSLRLDPGWDPVMHAGDGSDYADIILTSGTTGKSKGVLSTQSQVSACAAAWAENVKLTVEDRYLLIAPFSHVTGYKAGIASCVVAGATMYPLEVFDPLVVERLLLEERISVLSGPPTIYQVLLAQLAEIERPQLALRIGVTGAANVPQSLILEMKNRLGFQYVMTGYGLSEAVTVAMTRIGDPIEVISNSVGRPLAEFEVRIVSDTGEVMPPGVQGEIHVRGPNLMAGYVEGIEKKNFVLSLDADSEGWFDTEDIGVLSDSGNLQITGRKKEMFTVGGFNVFPAEVESVILEFPAVVDAAVIGVDDLRMGSVPVAFIETMDRSSNLVSGIMDHLRARLSNYKVPTEIRVVESLPRNEAGKVVKSDLVDFI